MAKDTHEKARKISQAVRGKLLAQQKKAFLKAFDDAACNISVACKKMNISRQTYYNWYEEDQEFKNAIDDSKESLIDYAETKLHQNIMEGKEASIFFFLKTQGKKRGYIETVQQDVNVNQFEKLLETMDDD